MGIQVNFNGAVIKKPGAYSATTVEQVGGQSVGQTGIVAIFGESSKGAPGSVEDIRANAFTPDQLPTIQAKYGSGPIVDAAKLIFSPSNDNRISNGASKLYVYKTNAATAATYTDKNAANTQNYGVVTSGSRGTAESQITETITDYTIDATLWSRWTTTGTSAYVGGKVIGAYVDPTTGLSIRKHLDSTKGAVIQATVPNTQLNSTIVVSGIIGGWAINADAIDYWDGSAWQISGLTGGPVVGPAQVNISLNRNSTRESSISGALGGNVGLTITPGSNASAAAATINTTTLTLTATGLTVTPLALTLASYPTIDDIVSAINVQGKGVDAAHSWTAAALVSMNQKSVSVLDRVTAQDLTLDQKIVTDASDVNAFYQSLSLVSYVPDVTYGFVGLPLPHVQASLVGGANGATAPSDITNALKQLQKVHVNFVVPLFSVDAATDIAVAAPTTHAYNPTASTSTYTIDAINAAVRDHCKLMSSTKNRSERQGFVSYDSTYALNKATAQTMASELISLCQQEVKVLTPTGTLEWRQPWMEACIAAGLQAGAPLGEPITFKSINVSGVRSPVGDFDPAIDYDSAIDAGILFVEQPASGGFRFVVGNTTYGLDSNFVWNRISVQYSAYLVDFDLRASLENQFTGVRSKVASPTSVRNFIIDRMNTYRTQGLIVGDSTNNGLGFKELVISQLGNTYNISISITPEEGIDFLLTDINLNVIRN